MLPVIIIVGTIVALIIGYITYGSWLAKKWGIDPTRKTPAVENEDGVDYVPAKPAVLLGHHFSSIAGAGPINGPIQAAVFGWVPVMLWCVLGGIFFGGLHDFGSLFASIRNGGKSIGEVIGSSMGRSTRKLFTVFALLVLLLVIASFVNVVSGTFMSSDDELAGGFITTGAVTGAQCTAMISLLFIVLAFIYGLLTNKAGLKTVPATIIGIILIGVITFIGLNVGIAAGRTFWIIFIGVYITVASLIPVWILLQPRDYLSSYLLYGMMLLAIVGIFVSVLNGHSAEFDNVPAFAGFTLADGRTLFPTLFITVACGACSGFHSLVSSGTTSKQLANEKNAKAIGYGAMLIESALGVVALIAVGMVFTRYQAGEFASPAAAFAAGIATMFSTEGAQTYDVIYALLTLAVSVFALTTLDTATRLSRFMFSELFLKEGEKSWRDARGLRKFLAHPLVGTLLIVVIGCLLGGFKLTEIWSLFGTANQLLAGIALMAVAAWLGDIGKSRKVFIFPMIFMLCAALVSLIMTIMDKLKGFRTEAGMAWGNWFTLILALAMVVLAISLIITAVKTFGRHTSTS